MATLAVTALFSMFAGVLLGLLGGGGSILAVPILLYLGHFAPRTAVTLSLLMVGTASLVAVFWHARAGHVNLRAMLAFGISSIVGSALGGHASHWVSSRVALAGFTLMMIVTGVTMFSARRLPNASTQTSVDKHGSLRVATYGLAVGILTGLVGAGGGFVIVPVLSLMLGLTMPTAIGTSLAIIAGNSLLAFAVRGDPSQVPWMPALILTLSSVVGSIMGVVVAHRTSPQRLRKGFALLVLTIAMGMALQQVLPHVS